MSTTDFPRKTFTTAGGVDISYIATGPDAGPVLLLLHGWSQSALTWKKQIAHFSAAGHYRIIAPDYRGHGESARPNHGIRVSRLAADVHELLVALDLRDVNLLVHSMGCGVTWCLWDTYADFAARVRKIVFVDQVPCMVADPHWDEGFAASISANFEPAGIFEIASGMANLEFSEGIVRSLFSPTVPDDEFAWIMEQNLKVSRQDARTLLISHSLIDWRDVIPRISVPTLVVGGEASLLKTQGSEWIAAQIKGARLEIFKASEGGSHFMFWENPTKFNSIVEEFLDE